ncbi:protein CMS1 [Sporothrix brasiliensis 5110]|uniref:Protein CMS1 n=1 Tax=Sporothrix brasiliensis 5110 TaxID=1398154 RepID=A0A0C2EMK8_9PEZI|nr:protein CMS1 [Sporothrix brasiliensis 5110]KIH87329.1 protein CMS1 [Sporothrix brasiliensis 5110]
MSGRQPLPPPEPPKPTRPPFKKSFQGKRKRDDAGGDNVNGFVPPPGGDRRAPRPKKQKKEGDDTDKPRQRQTPPPPLSAAEKRAKFKAKKQRAKEQSKLNNNNNNNNNNNTNHPYAVNEADLDYDLALNRSFARMDGDLAAAYLARQTKRYGSDLSEVELADLSVPRTAFVDASAYDKDRTLDNLADFLEAMASITETGKPGSKGKGKQILHTAPDAKGAPHTIVVTGAGQRAADLVRAVRAFGTKNNAVAKLFAKHIKLAEAVSFLGAHRTGLAVGTPARLIDLLDNGALSVAHLRRIVVDASHIDQKKRGVLDMPDTVLPVARWLSRPEIKARYKDGETEGDVADEKDTAKDGPKPISILFY